MPTRGMGIPATTDSATLPIWEESGLSLPELLSSRFANSINTPNTQPRTARLSGRGSISKRAGEMPTTNLQRAITGPHTARVHQAFNDRMMDCPKTSQIKKMYSSSQTNRKNPSVMDASPEKVAAQARTAICALLGRPDALDRNQLIPDANTGLLRPSLLDQCNRCEWSRMAFH
jgi:hypothetical protein